MEIYTLWFIIFVIVLVIKAAIGICFCIRRREQRRQIQERNLANNNNPNHQNWTSNNQVFVVRAGKHLMEKYSFEFRTAKTHTALFLQICFTGQLFK